MLNQFASSCLLSPIRRRYVAKAASRFLGYSSVCGLFMSGTTAMTLCESSDDNKSFFDTILPKDKDGKIAWDKAPQQVTDSIFWDKVAKAAGYQVRAITQFYNTVCRSTGSLVTESPFAFPNDPLLP